MTFSLNKLWTFSIIRYFLKVWFLNGYIVELTTWIFNDIIQFGIYWEFSMELELVSVPTYYFLVLLTKGKFKHGQVASLSLCFLIWKAETIITSWCLLWQFGEIVWKEPSRLPDQTSCTMTLNILLSPAHP